MSAIQSSHNRYEQALQLNRDALQSEVSAVANATQQTVQLQQQVQQGLSDRVALLEAELAAARGQAARAEADLLGERVASAAKDRLITHQQGELAQLRPGDALLRQMVITIDVLDQQAPESWPEWRLDSLARCGFDDNEIALYTNQMSQAREKFFSRTGSYIPTPPHWESILAAIKRAKRPTTPAQQGMS